MQNEQDWTSRGAIWWHQDYVIEELEVPEPGPGEVLIRIKLSGICGTDIHNWKGGPAAAWVKYPVVYGHKIVGTIEALGEGFYTDCFGRKLEVGDQVVPGIAIHCGTCHFSTDCQRSTKGSASYQNAAMSGGSLCNGRVRAS